METWQAINTVRVVRRFADRPLTPEHLDRILNAARRTGSSKNEQKWAFISVTDREVLHQLTGVGRYADHLAGAAVAVALVTADDRGRGSRSLLWDLGRAAQSMVLAAWELGIGSAPATVFDFDLAARLLGLPDGQKCHYLLSFGYPADPSALTAPNKPRRPQAARRCGSPGTLVGPSRGASFPLRGGIGQEGQPCGPIQPASWLIWSSDGIGGHAAAQWPTAGVRSWPLPPSDAISTPELL